MKKNLQPLLPAVRQFALDLKDQLQFTRDFVYRGNMEVDG